MAFLLTSEKTILDGSSHKEKEPFDFLGNSKPRSPGLIKYSLTRK